MRSRRNAMAGAAALGVAGVAAAAGAQPAAEAGPIRSDEYWAEKGAVRLYLYRKRLDGAPPRAGTACGAAPAAGPREVSVVFIGRQPEQSLHPPRPGGNPDGKSGRSDQPLGCLARSVRGLPLPPAFPMPSSPKRSRLR